LGSAEPRNGKEKGERGKKNEKWGTGGTIGIWENAKNSKVGDELRWLKCSINREKGPCFWGFH